MKRLVSRLRREHPALMFLLITSCVPETRSDSNKSRLSALFQFLNRASPGLERPICDAPPPRDRLKPLVRLAKAACQGISRRKTPPRRSSGHTSDDHSASCQPHAGIILSRLTIRDSISPPGWDREGAFASQCGMIVAGSSTGVRPLGRGGKAGYCR